MGIQSRVSCSTSSFILYRNPSLRHSLFRKHSFATNYFHSIIPNEAKTTHLHQIRGIASTSVLSSDKRKNVQEKINLPSGSTVVIAGGGIIGCSVAYHLSKEGMKDIILLEQGRLAF